MNQALPWHRAMVLDTDRSKQVPQGMDYEDSRCFMFDYNATDSGNNGDPHGCGLFRRSFSRLKALRTCIVKELGASPTWTVFRVAAGLKVAEGRSDKPMAP